MLGLSRPVEVAFGVSSVVMFVGTLVAIPLILVRVPDDWFVRPKTRHSLAKKITRTIVGLVLIALGLAMLVLPGQGILTILVGLGVLDLPFKHRLVTKLLSRPRVHEAVDKLRHKAGRGSLRLPGSSSHSVPA
jgi:hypothetical protein